MASTQDIQTLLRFLTQDAKMPLAQALSKVPDLQAANLTSPSDLAKSNAETLESIFTDPKTARQVLNASKRVSKKRATQSPNPPPKKRKQTITSLDPLTGPQIEASLALPAPVLNEEILKSAVIYTNRAPLLLAFALTLLKYTMSTQPLSSRLSLAQAVTSMNSRAKAQSIGLEKGEVGEEEGWAQGQPRVCIMTREIRVMKRWGYEWQDEDNHAEARDETGEPPLWAVDLDAVRNANQAAAPPRFRNARLDDLHIYSPQSARAYLMKAFNTPAEVAGDNKVKADGQVPVPGKSKSKRTAATMAAEKEGNLSLLLGALDLLYSSWSPILSKEDLDKRAWVWYVRVRPEVAQGAAGWGEKGNVKLGDILDLRRRAG
ncbi:hypothetical protein BDW02DRAFT_572948 [Decorospora gaudefroyi]|uniref:Impact N-terminal domain-containing protein n=1 Tax=Decorospora gaudefroyi TaxID=184978 RepID=A0A6A5K0N8_9PLEO|nr:hypothetical protein BDW02DRAFT_572948 [Decorospora gaudefroyi]